MAVLIDGKKISAQVKDECKERVAKEIWIEKIVEAVQCK